MRSKARIRYAIREILSLAGMGVALFWSAGRLDWWPAWAALAVMAFWIGATAYIVLYRYPELLAERLGPRQGEKRWDTAIVGLIGLVTLVRYILAGLDQRYGWTGGFPVWVQFAALTLCVLGNDVLFVWAAAANTYFRASRASSPSAATQLWPAARTATCDTRLTPGQSCTNWPYRFCSPPGRR
jgi:hypothetical protein